MPSKNAQKMKFGKFNKKKIDEQQYFLCKVSGKVPSKITKALKIALNEVVDKIINPPQDVLTVKDQDV